MRGHIWSINTVIITDENTVLRYISYWSQKYRKQLLKGCIADDVKQKIYDIYNRKGIDIVAMETDKDHIHLLIRYDATDRVCDIVKLLKQETTYYLRQKYPDYLSRQYWKRKVFWSDGYFVCSIGEVSSSIIQKYIESQG